MSNVLWLLLLSFTLVVKCTLYKKKTAEQWISGIIIVMGGTCVKHELYLICRNGFLNTPLSLKLSLYIVKVDIYSTIITLVKVKIALECRVQYTNITYIYIHNVYIHIHKYVYTYIYIYICMYNHTSKYCIQNGNIEVNIPNMTLQYCIWGNVLRLIPLRQSFWWIWIVPVF